jgi:TPR repeat protein
MNPFARFIIAAAGLAAAWSASARADGAAGIAAFQSADYPAALRELEPAAKAGEPDAAFVLGRMYAAGLGVAKDPVRAVELFRVAAERGHAEAQHNLGAALFLGEGVEQDMTEGLKWIVVAGNNGHQTSQSYLTRVTPYVTKSLMLEARKRAREWQASSPDKQTGSTGGAPEPDAQ